MKFAGMFLTGAVLFSHTPVAAQDAPVDKLRASFAAPARLSYIGEVETIRFRDQRADATIVRIEHRAPNDTRRWYLAPPALYGDSVVTRDRSTFEFDEHRHLLIRGGKAWHDDFSRDDRFALINKNYRATFGGSTMIAGRRALRLTLISRATGRRAIALWLDAENHLPLERETYRADGSITFRMRFTSIRYLANLPLNVFATNLPSGFRVINDTARRQFQARDPNARSSGDVAAAPRDPRELPDGFRLVRVSATEIGGVTARHLVYSDGVRTLSLFASPRAQAPVFHDQHPQVVMVGQARGEYLESGTEGLLTWPAREQYFTLVGNLGRDELLEIAAALK